MWAAACIVYFMLSGLPPFQGQGDYVIFQKIEKLDYNFPDTFHQRGKQLVQALLKLEPGERLGAKRKDDDIKRHEFFTGIRFVFSKVSVKYN